MPTLCIPFVDMPAKQNPNVKSWGSSSEIYLRSAYVALSSFSRWNQGWTLVFATPSELPAKWSELYRLLGVEVRLIPFRHEPPEGFTKTFAGSLYLLDALENCEFSDFLVLLDPDVLTTGRLNTLSPMKKNAVSAIEIPLENDGLINGLAVQEALELHANLGSQTKRYTHFGGEFYGIPKNLQPTLKRLVEEAWSLSLTRFAEKRPHFTTEEHILSYALSQVDVSPRPDLVRRIWTSYGYQNIVGDEYRVPLWHLPSEKQRGLKRLFKLAMNGSSWYWQSNESEFMQKSARICSVFDISTKSKIFRTLARTKSVFSRQ